MMFRSPAIGGVLRGATGVQSSAGAFWPHVVREAQVTRHYQSRSRRSACTRRDGVVVHATPAIVVKEKLGPDPWERVIEAEKNGDVVEVKVKSFNKGGLIVMLGELKGFMPYTCMANATLKKGHLGDLSYLVGQMMRAKIVSVDTQGPKKEIILSERKAQQSDSMRMLKMGSTVRGVVVAVEEYGAFVELTDLPGVSGLVHKTELSWDAVMTVDAVLTTGQTVKAKIIDVDSSKCRLGLSIKQLTDDPIKMTLDKVEWGATRNMMMEVQQLVERLQVQEGVDEVYIGRQAQERSITSKELGVYLTREEVAGGYNVVARLGNTVQELLITTKLGRDEIKQVLQRAARG